MTRPLQTGIWRVDVRLEKEQHMTRTEVNADLLHSQAFLILPTEESILTEDDKSKILEVSDHIDQFWSLKSICVKNVEGSNSLSDDCEDSYWSTMFPDSKSDFIHVLNQGS